MTWDTSFFDIPQNSHCTENMDDKDSMMYLEEYQPRGHDIDASEDESNYRLNIYERLHLTRLATEMILSSSYGAPSEGSDSAPQSSSLRTGDRMIIIEAGVETTVPILKSANCGIGKSFIVQQLAAYHRIYVVYTSLARGNLASITSGRQDSA
ncbi:uncharacterized protein ASPGLDRAFT_317585 [Aspergillus glaucus CBS 516.65]|uniref:Uncharacterized protein n=1 Tax=Aspergillus glaucus CBS 516.65 TaxID=1160497 RepID=A0A1L9VK75_ASPGL|nr:hypothetical protein ASPGLDRAFT_317585 [Aspergillus glaucus CBS 516.65]OJJ84304.1 hypothetical protein ASPGLDRAFT_317585 [Aspergillus glaucus CBS 516.65]